MNPLYRLLCATDDVAELDELLSDTAGMLLADGAGVPVGVLAEIVSSVIDAGLADRYAATLAANCGSPVQLCRVAAACSDDTNACAALAEAARLGGVGDAAEMYLADCGHRWDRTSLACWHQLFDMASCDMLPRLLHLVDPPLLTYPGLRIAGPAPSDVQALLDGAVAAHGEDLVDLGDEQLFTNPRFFDRLAAVRPDLAVPVLERIAANASLVEITSVPALRVAFTRHAATLDRDLFLDVFVFLARSDPAASIRMLADVEFALVAHLGTVTAEELVEMASRTIHSGISCTAARRLLEQCASTDPPPLDGDILGLPEVLSAAAVETLAANTAVDLLALDDTLSLQPDSMHDAIGLGLEHRRGTTPAATLGFVMRQVEFDAVPEQALSLLRRLGPMTEGGRGAALAEWVHEDPPHHLEILDMYGLIDDDLIAALNVEMVLDRVPARAVCSRIDRWLRHHIADLGLAGQLTGDLTFGDLAVQVDAATS